MFCTVELNHEILQKEVEINEFIEIIQKINSEKKNNITEVFDHLDIEIPNINYLQDTVNKFISENNRLERIYLRILKAKEQD